MQELALTNRSILGDWELTSLIVLEVIDIDGDVPANANWLDEIACLESSLFFENVGQLTITSNNP